MHLTTAAQQQWVGAADSSLDDSGLRSKETESETHEERVIARSMCEVSVSVALVCGPLSHNRSEQPAESSLQVQSDMGQ